MHTQYFKFPQSVGLSISLSLSSLYIRMCVCVCLCLYATNLFNCYIHYLVTGNSALLRTLGKFAARHDQSLTQKIRVVSPQVARATNRKRETKIYQSRLQGTRKRLWLNETEREGKRKREGERGSHKHREKKHFLSLFVSLCFFSVFLLCLEPAFSWRRRIHLSRSHWSNRPKFQASMR